MYHHPELLGPKPHHPSPSRIEAGDDDSSALKMSDRYFSRQFNNRREHIGGEVKRVLTAPRALESFGKYHTNLANRAHTHQRGAAQVHIIRSRVPINFLTHQVHVLPHAPPIAVQFV